MSVAVSMPHTENGVTVNFPDANYFQFENCHEYSAVKGKGIKEMDFIWWESSTNILWMVELKGFYNPANPRHRETDLGNLIIVEEKLDELYNKSVHTLCMIENSRIGTLGCHSLPIDPNTKFKIIHLLHVNPIHEVFLQGMKDKLDLRLQHFKILYNVSSVAVVSYQIAKSGLLHWVI